MDLVQSQTQSYSDESLCRLAASGDPLAETELECVPARFFW